MRILLVFYLELLYKLLKLLKLNHGSADRESAALNK